MAGNGTLRVQEIEHFVSESLQPPQGHILDQPSGFRNSGRPGSRLPGPNQCSMGLSQIIDDGNDGRLLASILLQDAVRAIGNRVSVGSALSPVQLDEFFSNCANRQIEFAAIIRTELDREVGNGQEQGVLVGCNKLALRQKALNLAEKDDLFFRGRGGN